MQTTIQLNTSQLDNNFLDAIKKLFNNQQIEIKIRSFDETDYLLSDEANRNHLKESMAEYSRGDVKTFTIQEFLNKYQGLTDYE
jgi:hypothetical protein